MKLNDQNSWGKLSTDKTDNLCRKEFQPVEYFHVSTIECWLVMEWNLLLLFQWIIYDI